MTFLPESGMMVLTKPKGELPVKRLICAVMAMCLLLCACGGEPAPTTAAATVPTETAAPAATESPTETMAPAETAVPGVDNDMSYREEDLPIPEDPSESAALPPAEDSTAVVRIEDPETMIYAGPAFRHGAAAMVGEAGTYTIVEEVTDADGNLWGRLKSGAGWLCLTEPPRAPIYADYAAEDFNTYHAYWSDETDCITSIGFTPGEKLTDVEFGRLDWFETESYQMAEVLYNIDEMDPEHCFLAQVVFWGDMTTYGIRFTDEDGEVRHYAVSISGKDGSLICTEYEGE